MGTKSVSNAKCAWCRRRFAPHGPSMEPGPASFTGAKKKANTGTRISANSPKTTGANRCAGMNGVGMDTIVIQEVFRNQAYYDKHDIATNGYRGLGYYPSDLYPGRAAMTSHDPIEAILSEADRLNMNVFLGVGAYAWFDFSPGALDWSKKVAVELWKRYGHHPSFYGWYVSAEAYGSLIPDQGEGDKDHYRQQTIDFFREFQAYCRGLAPEKPVMVAPNTHGLMQSKHVWPLVLKHVDIICPFGFHRMPAGDLTGEQAAELLQSMCDKAGTHLWMDMEAFLFEGKALVPRPIDGLIRDMQSFSNFEKILCYQYPGIFNAPGSRITPGGRPQWFSITTMSVTCKALTAQRKAPGTDF